MNETDKNKIDETDKKFKEIKSAYLRFENHLKDIGIGLVYDTEKGIYGTTDLNKIFKFFKDIHLEKYKHFLDLGCGDCRVVLVASLFTKATGIEYSNALVQKGKEIKNKLKIDCELVVGDYLDFDLSSYDIIFINPDHAFEKLDTKLKKELKGQLFIYNEIFAPNFLKKGKKYWADQLPIIPYTN